MARLKVYQARMGFYDSVVAAPSQKAALNAWGARQNLFAEGQASVADDPAAIEAALAHPQTPLRRAIGSDGAFGLESGVPNLPDAPAPPKSKAVSAKAKPQPAKPQPDRSRLKAAEAALAVLQREQARQADALRRKRQALEAEEAELESKQFREMKAAKDALEQERRAFQTSGGRV